MTSILQRLSKSLIQLIEPNVNRFTKSGILATQSNITDLKKNQIRHFRDKGVLKLRCDKCYFRKLDDRWWVLCNAFPRHKQRQKVHDFREKWIVTHVTRGGRPFQKKTEAYICQTSPPAAYDYEKRIWHWEDIKKRGVFPRLGKKDYRF